MSSRKSLRVLLIDDDETVRLVLESYLAKHGHKTTTATTGRGGIEALKLHDFDVVVTDMLLPDGDGIDVLNHIRAAKPAIRVVTISGGGRYLGPDFYKTLARASGATVSLKKPFGMVEFVEAVEG